MANVPHDQARDAHYHPVKSTEQWAAFVKALAAVTVDPAAVRARKLAERKRETTYARGQEGRH
jgi:hypothetical protein